MTVEKRFHKRMDIDIDVHILHRERHITATAEDITPYGMLLRTDKLAVPNGMLLEISIELDNCIKTISGLVIWTRQNRIGVMFPQIQSALYTAAEAYADRCRPSKPRAVSSAQTASIGSKHRLFLPEPHPQI